MKHPILRQALANQDYSHAYLLIGMDQNLIQEEARDFAEKILVFNERRQDQWTSGNLTDFLDIQPAGKQISIDKIREITSFFSRRPLAGEKKIVLIEQAEKMSKEAANALLKTLEDPPNFGLLVLCCQQEKLLLETIRSRCQKIYYYENFSQAYSFDIGEVFDILDAVFSQDLLIMNDAWPFFEEHGDEALEALLDILRDLYICKEAGTKEKLGFSATIAFAEKYDRTPTGAIENCREKIKEILAMRKYNLNMRLSMEEALLYMMEEISSWK